MAVVEPDTWTWPDAYDAPCPPADGWMRAICSNDEAVHERARWSCDVQRIELAGRTWSCATDVRSAIYVADFGAEAGACIRDRRDRYREIGGGMRKHVVDYLLKPLKFDFECDLLDLLAFVGPFTLEDCIRCSDGRSDGTSIGCEECDFTGRIWPVKRDVRIRWPNRWFDPNRLAQVLTPLVPLGVKRLRCGFLLNSLEPDQQPFAAETISDDGRPPWVRVITMGLLGHVVANGETIKQRHNIGTPRYLPGIGALWHNYGGFEMPLRDWIIEQGEDPDDVMGVPF